MSGMMLQLMRLARRRCGAQTRLLSTQAAEVEEQPPKYEHVRKLIVGLGNPGDKFKRTR